MSCLRLHSRTSVPTAPRKYLVVTMVEALTDQVDGNSTPRCSKTVAPVFQLVCTTSRRSHVSWSYGCTPSVLKTRAIDRPAPFFRSVLVAFGFTVSVIDTPLDPGPGSLVVGTAAGYCVTAYAAGVGAPGP